MVMLIIVLVFHFVSVSWWIWRRNHYLLRKRSTSFMLMTSIGIIFFDTQFLYRIHVGLINFNCDLYLWRLIALPLTLGPIMVRLALVYNKARFSKMLVRRDEENSVIEQYNNMTTARALQQYFLTFFGITTWLRGDSRDQVDDPSVSSSTKSILRRENQEKRLLLAYMTTTHLHGVFIFFGITMLLFMYIIYIMAVENSPYGGRGCVGCTATRFDALILGFTIVFILFFAWLMLCRLRGEDDPLGMIKELRLQVILMSLCIIIVVITVIDPGDLEKTRTFPWNIFIPLIFLVVHAIQCPLQVYRTYGQKEFFRSKVVATSSPAHDQDSSRSPPPCGEGNSFQGTVTMEEILASPVLKQVFARYLATEFSAENYYFISAVERYRKLFASNAPLSNARETAIKIHRTFFHDFAMMSINISHGVKREIETVVFEKDADDSRFKPDLFDSSYREVVNMMKRDSFQRFLLSDLYKNTIQP